MNITRHIKSFPNQTLEYADIEAGNLRKKYVAYLEDEKRIDWNTYVEPPHDYSKDYCTMVVSQPGYVRLQYRSSPQTVSLEASIDDGNTWKSFNPSSPFRVSSESGARVLLRGNNTKGFSQGTSGGYTYLYYSSTNTATTGNVPINTLPYSMEGNIMSLITKTNFDQALDLTVYGQCTFRSLFAYAGIVSAENLVLPAMTLSQYCYWDMFAGSQLVTPPKVLPATLGIDYAYREMFYNCRELTTMPQMELAQWRPGICSWMFRSCVKLTKTSVLKIQTNYQIPAAAARPYDGMFAECPLTEMTIISTPPSMPLDNLLQGWIDDMTNVGVFYVKPDTVSQWEAYYRGTRGVPKNFIIEEYEG